MAARVCRRHRQTQATKGFPEPAVFPGGNGRDTWPGDYLPPSGGSRESLRPQGFPEPTTKAFGRKGFPQTL
jgi:hypothetical protein